MGVHLYGPRDFRRRVLRLVPSFLQHEFRNGVAPVISSWGNGWHGLDALANPWNIVLGLAVMFLAQVLGLLYMTGNIDDDTLRESMRKRLWASSAFFLVFCVAFLVHIMT